MRSETFLDTAYAFTLLFESDAHYERVIKLVEQRETDHTPLVTTRTFEPET